MHWTQKPENREKVLAHVKHAAAAHAATAASRKKKKKPGQLSDAGRKRIAAAMRRRWREAKKAGRNINATTPKRRGRPPKHAPPAAGVNGHSHAHATPGRIFVSHATTRPTPAKIAKAALLELARAGARERLHAIELERQTLIVFLRAQPRPK